MGAVSRSGTGLVWSSATTVFRAPAASVVAAAWAGLVKGQGQLLLQLGPALPIGTNATFYFHVYPHRVLPLPSSR